VEIDDVIDLIHLKNEMGHEDCTEGFYIYQVSSFAEENLLQNAR
jgi:hypothetical protein